MPRKPSVDWAVIREQFVSRRAVGETFTLKSFAAEMGLNYVTLGKHAREGVWEELAQVRGAELARKIWDKVEINESRIRGALTRLHEQYAQATEWELQEFLAHRKEQIRQGVKPGKVERDWVAMLTQLGQMTEKFGQTGGGLPKEHRVSVEDHEGEIVWNRKQQQQLQAKVVELREYAKLHHLGPYRKKKQQKG